MPDTADHRYAASQLTKAARYLDVGCVSAAADAAQRALDAMERLCSEALPVAEATGVADAAPDPARFSTGFDCSDDAPAWTAQQIIDREA